MHINTKNRLTFVATTFEKDTLMQETTTFTKVLKYALIDL